ncbi:pyrroloquinoline quinone biosynthesis protein PqqF [Stutzerimonas zhaodongensis]|uniref:Coenzyme PQQ synthesis protein F n=1 Tax=Stutzerimonas zhaodongensis TaxID=1176257 RepID=A0A365PRQ8_9GAMM|nr:pyrroloquinoline quinone biosynthesis protein PqqF [Stutzerimonas zhaodongensis]QWV15914.1 pyrroloquinoline quinone biosynthesis protein PqqF [Stutzerimonas zhaodongensis]RBA54241.1 pyrroloquinoline quinone biosynthesis protein PqqF [Stutzerimonas zhaodongensis]
MHSSADPVQQPSQTILPNGLRVRLIPLLGSSQAAALVRVHAGSHDAPSAYPGLAHFLEHLLFLGSRNYTAAEGLMPFVQGCGGQLNASTRERHTDFFFQLPADQLEEGLRRLVDMLANPLLDPGAQLREREVLQAEYQARAQDAETLCDAALGHALDPTHPFAGFHAGNRDTLPVEDVAFQEALLGYHRRFYHAGQIELLLAGPQHEEVLQCLAEQMDAGLASHPLVRREVPPMRCKANGWFRLQLSNAQPRHLLAFALDGLPEHAVPALDYLSTWLASEAPGGLTQRLRDAELCQSVKLRIPYWYAGQGVVVVELLPTELGMAAPAELVEAVLDWLRFFSDDARWQPCHEEYQRIRHRSLQNAEPLTRLRYWVDPLAWSLNSEEAAIKQALSLLTAQMLGCAPLVLITDKTSCPAIETSGFPLCLQSEPPQQTVPTDWGWQQPAVNPWLKPELLRYEAADTSPALRWQGPEDMSGQGALFLRWQFMRGESFPALSHTLMHALQSVAWAAQQAGVALRFEDLGDAWCLRLEGFAEAIPAILSDIMAVLSAPPAAAFTEGQALADRDAALSSDVMLVRQLLNRLPRLLTDPTAVPGLTAASSSLARLWQTAQWQGLAIGFASSMSGPLTDAVHTLPGTPMLVPVARSMPVTVKRWHDVSGAAAMPETAFLLFCPLPDRTAKCEASWRVLGRLIEADFFRRLRSELQLGYAVFSRFCQFGEEAGMLFAVQSPTASANEILDHVEQFLSDSTVKLAEQDDDVIERAARQASDRHVASASDFRAQAEQAWQSLQAGHEIDRPIEVAAAMRTLQRQDLTVALEALRLARAGWVAVANASAPDAGWT